MTQDKHCDWHKGKSGIPDLKKCKKCPDTLNCLGRAYIKWQKKKGLWDDPR